MTIRLTLTLPAALNSPARKKGYIGESQNAPGGFPCPVARLRAQL